MRTKECMVPGRHRCVCICAALFSRRASGNSRNSLDETGHSAVVVFCHLIKIYIIGMLTYSIYIYFIPSLV